MQNQNLQIHNSSPYIIWRINGHSKQRKLRNMYLFICLFKLSSAHLPPGINVVQYVITCSSGQLFYMVVKYDLLLWGKNITCKEIKSAEGNTQTQERWRKWRTRVLQCEASSLYNKIHKVTKWRRSVWVEHVTLLGGGEGIHPLSHRNQSPDRLRRTQNNNIKMGLKEIWCAWIEQTQDHIEWWAGSTTSAAQQEYYHVTEHKQETKQHNTH
jgi:hypothetical protein